MNLHGNLLTVIRFDLYQLVRKQEGIRRFGSV